MDRYDAVLKNFVNGTQQIYEKLLNTIILYDSSAKADDVDVMAISQKLLEANKEAYEVLAK